MINYVSTYYTANILHAHFIVEPVYTSKLLQTLQDDSTRNQQDGTSSCPMMYNVGKMVEVSIFLPKPNPIVPKM